MLAGNDSSREIHLAPVPRHSQHEKRDEGSTVPNAWLPRKSGVGKERAIVHRDSSGRRLVFRSLLVALKVVYGLGLYTKHN